MTTLRDYAGAKLIKAANGKNGEKRQKFGEKGSDKVLEVPVGTVVYLLGENQIGSFTL